MWDVAKSLDVLLWQINTMAPGRSKVSDGSIGDNQPGHQTPKSEHYPEDKPWPEPDEVDARDFTHDPGHGADMDRISEEIRVSHDWRVKYVIWRQHMFSSYPMAGYPAWAWRPYAGDYHEHLHVSLNDVDDDNQTLWAIGPWAAPQEDEMRTVLVNLTGRSTVFVKAAGEPLRALQFPDTFELLVAAGAVKVAAKSAKAIVEAYGPLGGQTAAASIDYINRAG